MQVRQPIAWHVARWGDDVWSQGSWTALRPGGSPDDRRTLGLPVDDRFVMAGDCSNPTQPSMVHGAYEEGLRAAEWAASVTPHDGRVIIIGAGFAGLAAASRLGEVGVTAVVLEARDRIGGRAHSVDVAGVVADAGAAWLQQIERNPLARMTEQLGLAIRRTDFHAPLAAAVDGWPPGAVESALDGMAAVTDEMVAVGDVLQPYLDSLRPQQRRIAQFAVDLDIDLENGVPHHELSAKWVFDEPGVGAGDAWLPGGYRQLADHLADGVDIRLNNPVRTVRWNPRGVTVDDVRGDCCICTIPAWLTPGLDLQPGLPLGHREALANLAVGVVEKVVLRFDERWWPHDGNGYLRWYATPASWGEWLDLTDGVGQPCVAALIARDGVARLHHGQSDADVALAATHALAGWAEALRR